MKRYSQSKDEIAHINFGHPVNTVKNKKQPIRLNVPSFLFKTMNKHSSMGNIHQKKNIKTKTNNHKIMSMTNNNTFGFKSKYGLGPQAFEINYRSTCNRFVRDMELLKENADEIIKSLKATQIIKYKSHSNKNKETQKPTRSKNSFLTALNHYKTLPFNLVESNERTHSKVLSKTIIEDNKLSINDETNKDNDDNNENEENDDGEKNNEDNSNSKSVAISSQKPEEIPRLEIQPKLPPYRKRLLRMTKDEVLKHSHKIFFIPISLAQAKTDFLDTSLQILAITDQFKLIEANILQFKYDYLYSTFFNRAFHTQEEINKHKFNLLLEETSTLLFNLIPRLIKKVYHTVNEILYCKIPSLKDEEKRLFSNEDDCLLLDTKWFGEVSTFFTAAIEVFHIIQKKEGFLKYTNKQYFMIKVYLDAIRYNTNSLITTAKTMISKVRDDKKMLYEFEAEIGLKPKLKRNISCDVIQRYHDKERLLHEKQTNNKMIRIKAALDSEKEFEEYQRRLQKLRQNNDYRSQISVLTTPLINSMLPFYDKETRQQIIAFNVVERYRRNEIENQKQVLTKEQELQRQQHLAANEKQ